MVAEHKDPHMCTARTQTPRRGLAASRQRLFFVHLELSTGSLGDQVVAHVVDHADEIVKGPQEGLGGEVDGRVRGAVGQLSNLQSC